MDNKQPTDPDTAQPWPADSAPLAPTVAATHGRGTLAAIVALCVLLLVSLGVSGMTVIQLMDMQSQLTTMSGQLAGLSSQVAAGGTGTAAAAANITPATDLKLPAAPNIDNAGAVLIGDRDAKNVVEVFLDYQCPYCQKWEESTGKTLYAKALEPGSDLLVKQYNMAFLKETTSDLSKPGASARAANAVLCTAQHDGPAASVKLGQEFYKVADPSEPEGQFPLKQILKLAENVNASAATLECIKTGEHMDVVAAVTRASWGRGLKGTPGMTVNGKTATSPGSDPSLVSMLTPA